MKKKVINYIVKTRGFSGEKTTHCLTEKEVWDAIGKASFGALYEVSSPTNKDVDQFIPY